LHYGLAVSKESQEAKRERGKRTSVSRTSLGVAKTRDRSKITSSGELLISKGPTGGFPCIGRGVHLGEEGCRGKTTRRTWGTVHGWGEED